MYTKIGHLRGASRRGPKWGYIWSSRGAQKGPISAYTGCWSLGITNSHGIRTPQNLTFGGPDPEMAKIRYFANLVNLVYFGIQFYGYQDQHPKWYPCKMVLK